MIIERIPKIAGLIYGIVMIVVLAYLWDSGRWKQKIGWLLLAISAFLGFLIFAPLAPYQFQQLVLKDVQGLGASLIVAAVGLFIVFLLTFLFGRFFCGYLCPVGTVQEIMYHVPVPKFILRQKNAFMIVRAIFFVAFLVMAFAFSASLMAWFGIRDFFHLTLTATSAGFIILLLISMTFYRPFCRLVCPYGALLSIVAAKSIFRLQRTDVCINCKKCEKVCPADEAKREDAKAECYLCGRCTEVCPVEGALRYSGPHKTTMNERETPER